MYDFEIINILKDTSEFKGVFARDKIPEIKSFPFSIIMNTDKSHEPGKHWVAVHCTDRVCEYFDSFGIPPYYPEFRKLFRGKKLLWNDRCIQHPQSRKCGQFCISFVLARSQHIRFKDFVKGFNSDLKVNDRIVERISSKRMSYAETSSFSQ